jgi:hypothetical protein
MEISAKLVLDYNFSIKPRETGKGEGGEKRIGDLMKERYNKTLNITSYK